MNEKIPTISRDASLIKRLMPIVSIGMDGALDKGSHLYLRLLCRLIDNAYDEYNIARDYINHEIEVEDMLMHKFQIINHLENCLNAINRVIKIFDILINGVYVGKCDKRMLVKNSFNILSFFSEETIEKIKKRPVSKVRNRIEHINEDVYLDKVKGPVFLVIDDSYKQICVNGRCISFRELAGTIEDYHNFVLEICNNLPNRFENGIYYYNKK